MQAKSIIHLITNLEVGGAQTMLARLVERSTAQGYRHTVISLLDEMPMADQLRAHGAEVCTLAARRGPAVIHCLPRLRRLLAKTSPQVLQTWMIHSDLLGGLVAKLGLAIPVVWNIRMAHGGGFQRKSQSARTLRACALLSGWLPKRVVVNSQAGLRMCLDAGYAAERLQVITNGFDIDKYHPRAAVPTLRAELNLTPHAFVVGIIGRDHPHKDPHNFIRAAGRVAREVDNAHFVLCGKGFESQNESIHHAVRQTGYADRFRLLGPRTDTPALNCLFDVAVSSSKSEGFPNTVGEAMSCGRPVVATDSGGTRELLAEAGFLVAPQDDAALADGILQAHRLGPDGRTGLGQRARQTICDHYALDLIVDRYHSIWNSVVPQRTAA